MRFNRPTEPVPAPQKKRLKTKPFIALLGILFAMNVFWLFHWLLTDRSPAADTEEVASVAGEPITRAEWMSAMEQQVGREVLEDLVNHRVMSAAADEYGIKVSDKEIDLELALITSVDGQQHSGLDTEQTRNQIRSELILEKVLTKDVVIKESAIKKYFEQNEVFFHVLPAYRTSVIISSTEKEAKQVTNELKDGSAFSALAKERSVDLSSGNLGGDLGYVNAQTEDVDPQVVKTAESLKTGEVSKPVALKDGTYAVVTVLETIKERDFTYKEVKDHIKRQLALEQLPESISPEAFWKEFDAEWFYGKK
ncbi:MULTISPECIES: peptidylprolyl isomerase [unclassified Sporosarcina]|uniref:peptidylprolyl isomerase n=1 Tax=unclassified Sporosarcina TaxID=2647733 RepID=UPI00203DE3D1|nr:MULTISPECIES: peptidylprolyl isomerase [unclassified Sporosarcina]GKV66698.1 foldase protein PrsA [Sporosarcina sp. NCCP-2331]GLB56995.1 foldase protein PrsA [Sporosarcina sp. NCCP-2378]